MNVTLKHYKQLDVLSSGIVTKFTLFTNLWHAYSQTLVNQLYCLSVQLIYKELIS